MAEAVGVEPTRADLESAVLTVRPRLENETTARHNSSSYSSMLDCKVCCLCLSFFYHFCLLKNIQMATLELLNQDGLEAFEKVCAMNFSFDTRHFFEMKQRILVPPSFQAEIITTENYIKLICKFSPRRSLL